MDLHRLWIDCRRNYNWLSLAFINGILMVTDKNKLLETDA